MDKKPLTKTALADALGVSRQCVHRYAKQGMPCTSLDAARAWREHFLRPRVGMPRAPSVAMLIERAQSMQEAGAQLLERGNTIAFAALTPAIRDALRDVPPSGRESVMVSEAVMDRLTADVMDVCEREAQALRDEDAAKFPNAQEPWPAGFAEWNAERFLYEVAAGEWLVT